MNQENHVDYNKELDKFFALFGNKNEDLFESFGIEI